MTNATEKKREPLIMERHIQTVLLSVITAGILFGSGTIWNLSMQVVRMAEKIDALTSTSKNFVTMNEIQGMGKIRDQQFMDFDKRLTKVENKLETR